ncbi:MAG: hypothetical protein BMS9Abin08_1696 [Gammaproteobacteria bacterium]|nr:MAG: hypothetical protein BMS9Abin08_1696 [Gammaproteobacteria bacterium]
MDSNPIKLGDNGIPVLENAVTLDELASEPAPPRADLTDRDLINRLLEDEAVQHMLDDITEDLQKMVAWKIETFLKEEITRLIQDATEQSAPRLAQDIRTQLQLALPGLIAKLAEQSKGQ